VVRDSLAGTATQPASALQPLAASLRHPRSPAGSERL